MGAFLSKPSFKVTGKRAHNSEKVKNSLKSTPFKTNFKPLSKEKVEDLRCSAYAYIA